jgi:putative addiction module component (TIGR02574 family)
MQVGWFSFIIFEREQPNIRVELTSGTLAPLGSSRGALEPYGFKQEVLYMKLKQIEDEVLRMTEEERAELAQKLLLSLDAPSESEIAEDWLVEAQRRARDLDEGIVQPVPADEVRRKAQALLR